MISHLIALLLYYCPLLLFLLTILPVLASIVVFVVFCSGGGRNDDEGMFDRGGFSQRLLSFIVKFITNNKYKKTNDIKARG